MFFSINPKISSEKCNGTCEKVDKEGLLNESDRNYMKIVCRRCASIIFPDNAIEYIEGFPHELRVMSHQAAGPLQTEKISWWWYTKNDMDFDTVGWQTVDKKKVLMCGDCELGPIGFRSEDNKQFWVAVERVKYLPPDEEEDDSPPNRPSPPTQQAAKKSGAPVPTKRPSGKTN